MNSKPEILTTSLVNGQENLAYADTLEVTDPDEGDTHIFSLIEGPAWMNVSPEGIVSGTPGMLDTGNNIPVMITATDAGGLSDTLSVKIDIINIINVNSIFSLDTNLAEYGNQKAATLFNPGPERYLGFAVYAEQLTEIRSFRINLEWNGAFAELNTSRSGPDIPADSYDINGIDDMEFTGESNVLKSDDSTISDIVVENVTGHFKAVYAKMGGEQVYNSNGLLYLAVFKTFASSPVTEGFTISVDIDIYDDSGIGVPLERQTIEVQPYDGILPPSHFVVSDVGFDHGHMLQLSWTSSPHEDTGLVEYYRIYRSRDSEFNSPRPLDEFEDIDSHNAWDEYHTVLIDSVQAGIEAFIDRSVPLVGVPYFYWLQAVGHGMESAKIPSEAPVSVEESPLAFSVGAPYPNPFNPSTTIEYTLSEEGNARLSVYNIAGQRIAVLADGFFPPGQYSAIWNANEATSGIYFIVLNTGARKETRKVMLVK